MIPIPIEIQVLDLLAKGRLSNRSIAVHLGIGRTAVDAVARAGALRPRPKGRQGTTQKPKRLRTPGWCKACRCHVYWEPCVACTARDYLAQKRA